MQDFNEYLGKNKVEKKPLLNEESLMDDPQFVKWLDGSDRIQKIGKYAVNEGPPAPVQTTAPSSMQTPHGVASIPGTAQINPVPQKVPVQPDPHVANRLQMQQMARNSDIMGALSSNPALRSLNDLLKTYAR